LLQGRLLGRGGPTALTAVQVAAAAVATAFWAPFAGSLSIPVTTSALTSFGWLALVAGVIGPLLLLALIQRHGATRGTSLLFLVPSVTAFLGWALLRQPVGVVALVGFAVAGFGLWLGRRTPATVAVPARVPVTAGVRLAPEPELRSHEGTSLSEHVRRGTPLAAANRGARHSLASWTSHSPTRSARSATGCGPSSPRS
jgi:hypothetical protein